MLKRLISLSKPALGFRTANATSSTSFPTPTACALFSLKNEPEGPTGCRETPLATASTFNFTPSLNPRALMRDGRPWFVAKDVCAVLKIANVTSALRALGADEEGLGLMKTPGGPERLNCINESGLYALIMYSDKWEAQTFRKWVTSVVLTAILLSAQAVG